MTNINCINSANYSLYYHPFINPKVNPADILPVNGMLKLVIATEAAAAAWSSPLKPRICVLKFEIVVIVPSDTVSSLFQFMLAIC
jgi:hypothetical protein